MASSITLHWVSLACSEIIKTASPSSKISSKLAFYRHLGKDPTIKTRHLVFKYFPSCLRLSESLNVSYKNQFTHSRTACTRQNSTWYFRVFSRNSKTYLVKRMPRPCLDFNEALVLIHTCVTLKASRALNNITIFHSTTSPAPTQGRWFRGGTSSAGSSTSPKWTWLLI